MKKDVKVGERAKRGLEELRDADHQDIHIIHQENKQVHLRCDLPIGTRNASARL